MLHLETTFFHLTLAKSMATWLHSLRQNNHLNFQCTNPNRSTIVNPQMQIFAHFPHFQSNMLLCLVSPLNLMQKVSPLNLMHRLLLTTLAQFTHHSHSSRNIHGIHIVAVNQRVKPSLRRKALSPLPHLWVLGDSIEIFDWLRSHTHTGQGLVQEERG